MVHLIRYYIYFKIVKNGIMTLTYPRYLDSNPENLTLHPTFIRINNRYHMYTMNGVALEVATKERDIGVIISSHIVQNQPDELMPSLLETSRAFLYRD